MVGPGRALCGGTGRDRDRPRWHYGPHAVAKATEGLSRRPAPPPTSPRAGEEHLRPAQQYVFAAFLGPKLTFTGRQVCVSLYFHLLTQRAVGDEGFGAAGRGPRVQRRAVLTPSSAPARGSSGNPSFEKPGCFPALLSRGAVCTRGSRNAAGPPRWLLPGVC